jgi:Tfp pilus assembly protein PilV
MKTPRARHQKSQAGFTLVITISLLVLLTLVAIGLLSLSGVTIRHATQGNAMQEARANARLAMLLALGDLQKTLGPDQRISFTADQLVGTTAAAVTTNNGQKHFTGAYRSWESTAVNRPATPVFLQWFVSGQRGDVLNRDWVRNAPAGTLMELVSARAAVAAHDAIRVPMISQQEPNGARHQYAWWVSDLGTKALAAGSKPASAGQAQLAREAMQTMPAYDITAMARGVERPFQGVNLQDETLRRVTTTANTSLLAGMTQAAPPMVHDVTAFNRGLLTNVRSGGFRRDLSFYLEKDASQIPQDVLYSAGGQPGINMQELWLHYNMYKNLQRGARFSYTTGGSMPATAQYLQVFGSQAEAYTDQAYYYKQPTFIHYQTILSFHARSGTNATGQSGRFLQVVVDPVVTYWNPLDVPVVLTPAYNSIKFWQLPYDLNLTIGSRNFSVSLQQMLGNSEWHYLTLIAGRTQPIVLKPGEIMVVSEGPNTPIVQTRRGLGNNFVDGVAGWNFGGGRAFDVIDKSGATIFSPGNEAVRYEIVPNSTVSRGSRHWSVTHHECYYKEDRAQRGESIGIGGIFIDYIYGQPNEENNPKPAHLRISAQGRPDFFNKIPPSSTRTISMDQINGRKEPFMLYSYKAKTERGSERPARFLSRMNPKSMLLDYYDLSTRELDVLPFEVQIKPLNSFKTPLLEVSPNGNGYFGGDMNAQDGVSFITTHSVPREPVYSLAAMQHAFANGCQSLSPQAGYAVINGRQPLLPQISHPIGNSFAPSIMPANRTEDSLAGPRPLADHAFLANRALWDDWFFSSIAPQSSFTFPTKRTQQRVAQDFLERRQSLPLHRYTPALGRYTTTQALALLFSGSRPSPSAHTQTASLIEVDGMFNVNSTSVEAWKALLGSLKLRENVSADAMGNETIAYNANTPVANLNAPRPLITRADNPVDIKDPSQWVGYRTLSDQEISALAEAIVLQVRLRGPFLSLSDFINRRVSTDNRIAASGAIQSALDSDTVPINRGFRAAGRTVANTGAYPFPQAEAGIAAQGAPGVVKQADILTPIAPYLSARSDSFLIRAAGQKTDANGTVIARAYCEAVVQRKAEFIDARNLPTTVTASLNPTNRFFGRRFHIVSFRWLSPEEI